MLLLVVQFGLFPANLNALQVTPRRGVGASLGHV
jgi:hypothetical protein